MITKLVSDATFIEGEAVVDTKLFNGRIFAATTQGVYSLEDGFWRKLVFADQAAP